MKERPIIFSGPMVRAILSGAKTQTRRIIKPQPISAGRKSWERGHFAECENSWDYVIPVSGGVYQSNTINGPWRCPYGQPGDRLYVREAWQEFFFDELPIDRRDGPRGRMGIPAEPDRYSVVAFRADGEVPPHPKFGKANWRPSIHMPRWASRITLEIVRVKAERVQDISVEDCLAEGICSLYKHGIPPFPKDAFKSLWNEIHGPGAWDRNDWTWCLEFKKV